MTVSNRPPAVVFKLVSDPLQHGGLGITRSLGRLGIEVHAVYRDRGTAASRSRYATSSYVLRSGVENPDSILSALERVSRRLGEAVLIPIDDVASGFVDQHRGALPAEFTLPRQPPGLTGQLADKRRLTELCAEVGIPAPDSRYPRTRHEFLEMADALGYPVVVKSMDPIVLRSRPKAASVAIVEDPTEAALVYDGMEDPSQPNLMLQRFIPGGARSVWMFNGYFDADGRCLFGLTGQKLRQAPPGTGATSLGVCVDNARVRELAIQFLQRVGYRGIVDMGFRYDRRDDSYQLLDVNPRIGSSFRLFVDAHGDDVVRVLYRDLTEGGAPKVTTAPTQSRRWMVENQDLASSVKLMWRRQLGPVEWIRSLRGVDELAWYAWDDPRPFVAMLMAMARQVAAGLWRRARAR